MVQHWIVPYILIVLTLVAVLSPIAYYTEGRHADNSVHSAQLEACHRSNRVREAARDAVTTLTRVNVAILVHQIDQSRDLPHSFFPSIPAPKFRALVRRQDHQRRHQIHELRRNERLARHTMRPTHCALAVPPPA